MLHPEGLSWQTDDGAVLGVAAILCESLSDWMPRERLFGWWGQGSRGQELWLKVPCGCRQRRVARHPSWVWADSWPCTVSTPTSNGFCQLVGASVLAETSALLTNISTFLICHNANLTVEKSLGLGVWGWGIWSEDHSSACQGGQVTLDSLYY